MEPLKDNAQMDNTIKNKLNKLVSLYTEVRRVLTKNYKDLNLDTKFDKMIAIQHMDYLDPEKLVYALYNKFLTEYKYDQLALYYTIDKVEDFINEIEALMEGDEESESDDSRKK